ncbi:MAG: ABC transporter permease [Planctomycetaceae bacterium]
MSLWSIAWKSLKQRWLASSLTGFSVALGIALMVLVLIINGVFTRMFSQNSVGYDLVIGPKGSEWQLVLNTIFRVDRALNDMPWRYYEQLKEDPDFREVIPFAVADVTSEGQFPIVATIPRFFSVPYAYNRSFGIPDDGESTFLRGTWDAVVGSEVARKNGWKVGSTFQLLHSGTGEDAHIHDEKFTVVGVLAPTGTANDRTAFIHIDGFFLLDEHGGTVDSNVEREMLWFQESKEQIEQRYSEVIPKMRAEEERKARAEAEGRHYHSHLAPSVLTKRISAALVVMRGSPDRPNMDEINRSTQAAAKAAELRETFAAQGVQPFGVMYEIQDKLIGNVNLALLVLTVVIVIVSGIGIFVSIYNSMSDRRRQIAILRALGAPRSSVFLVILFESLILCVGGCLVGLLIGHGLVFIASPILEARSGFLVDPFSFERAELYLIPALAVMATLVGFLPGMTAYRTDVAQSLSE